MKRKSLIARACRRALGRCAEHPTPGTRPHARTPHPIASQLECPPSERVPDVLAALHPEAPALARPLRCRGDRPRSRILSLLAKVARQFLPLPLFRALDNKNNNYPQRDDDMARKNYVIREATIQAFIKEGRGEGDGPNYRPWLTIRDVPSRGRSHRTLGCITNRIHHTLSDGEQNVFLSVEMDPRTLDLREQYPMNRLETHRAALDLGYRPPTTPDGTPYVMTVDLLVTERGDSGNAVLRPLTFKYSTDDLTDRDQEKLEIASLYWARRGLRLSIIDETFYDERAVKKWAQIRNFCDLEHTPGVDYALIRVVAQDLGHAIMTRPQQTLHSYCMHAAPRARVASQTVFDVVRHLLARRIFTTDLGSDLRLEQFPLGRLRLTH